MKNLVWMALFSFCCFAAPQITASGARNGASYVAAVAPGARFVLVGKNLGPAEPVTSEAEPLQTQLGGVSIQVIVGDTTVDAFILQAGPRSVTAVLPVSTHLGTGKAVLTLDGASAETSIEVTSRALGLYASGAFGTGSAVAFATDEAGSAIALNAAAKPGQSVRLRATGLGESVDGDFEVRIGNNVANFISAQHTAASGIDELTVEVPAGIESCFVPVAVKSAGRWSNFVTLPVASGSSTCSSNRYGASSLDAIFAGGEANLGDVSLQRVAVSAEQGEVVTDSIAGSFERLKVSKLGGAVGSSMDIPAGSCMLLNAGTDLILDDQPVTEAIPLAAGQMTLSGPKGTKNLGNVKGAFSVELGSGFNIQLPPGVPPLPSNLYLDPGTYTLTSQGGDDVGAFTVQSPFNPAQWTNSASIISVQRANGLQLTWTGGGANDYVIATGASSAESGKRSVTFFCIAKASERQITVPAYILQALPASEGDASFLGLMSMSEPKAFTARGLDAGSISTSRITVRQVRYE